MLVIDIKKHTDRLDTLANRLDSLTANAMPIVAQSIKTQILLNYKQSKAPDGTAWTPLNPNTIKQKLKKSGTIVMLKDTGNLRNSLNSRATKTSAIIGYSAKYSIFHQLGTKFMPMRKILPTTEKEVDINRIKRIIEDELLNN